MVEPGTAREDGQTSKRAGGTRNGEDGSGEERGEVVRKGVLEEMAVRDGDMERWDTMEGGGGETC